MAESIDVASSEGKGQQQAISYRNQRWLDHGGCCSGAVRKISREMRFPRVRRAGIPREGASDHAERSDAAHFSPQFAVAADISILRLDGRTALISGGTGGIGAEIADLFAEASASVVVAGRRSVGGAAGSRLMLPMTTRWRRARELLGGRIDILVNSAARGKHATAVL